MIDEIQVVEENRRALTYNFKSVNGIVSQYHCSFHNSYETILKTRKEAVEFLREKLRSIAAKAQTAEALATNNFRIFNEANPPTQ